MQAHDPASQAEYTLHELCTLVDMPVRTVRFYVQQGLVSRPKGETRAARYGAEQLEQLLSIRKWSAAGLSLERIAKLLHGEAPPIAAPLPTAGSISVRSHIWLAQGVELVIDPTQAGLSPEQLRRLQQHLLAVLEAVQQVKTNQEE